MQGASLARFVYVCTAAATSRSLCRRAPKKSAQLGGSSKDLSRCAEGHGWHRQCTLDRGLMSFVSSRRLGWWCAAAVISAALTVDACILNPQPLPPGDTGA